MILSIKLLVATLGVNQFSGVVGTKQERDQLRRNLRQGQRKTQCKSFLDQFNSFPFNSIRCLGLEQIQEQLTHPVAFLNTHHLNSQVLL